MYEHRVLERGDPSLSLQHHERRDNSLHKIWLNSKYILDAGGTSRQRLTGNRAGEVLADGAATKP